MELKKNVVAAISSALGFYIQAEQEAAALLALQQKALAENPISRIFPTPWPGGKPPWKRGGCGRCVWFAKSCFGFSFATLLRRQCLRRQKTES